MSAIHLLRVSQTTPAGDSVDQIVAAYSTTRLLAEGAERFLKRFPEATDDVWFDVVWLDEDTWTK